MGVLSTEQKKKIVTAVKGGSSVETAAQLAGVKVALVQAEAGGDAAFARALRETHREERAQATDPLNLGSRGERSSREHSLPPGTETPWGALCWVNERCIAADMHQLSPWWLATFHAFYESKKLVLAGRVGLRGGKSSSCIRALCADAVFQKKTLDPGVVGVVPILSVDRTEASDRLTVVKATLRAIGYAPARGEDDLPPLPGGIVGEYSTKLSPTGGGLVSFLDVFGNVIEIRVYPARRTGAVGYTGVGGLCDEVDLWTDDRGKANPAEEVIDLLMRRFTTTIATSRLYIMSASYNATSAHARIVDAGDTELVHVARLGVDGARADDEARSLLAVSRSLSDPRLTEPAIETSPDVPAWVASPVAPIATCYALSKSDLGKLLGLYGGRPYASIAPSFCTMCSRPHCPQCHNDVRCSCVPIGQHAAANPRGTLAVRLNGAILPGWKGNPAPKPS